MKRPSQKSLRSKFFLASMAALAAGISLGGSSARAVSYSWTSTTANGTMDFNTGTNWTPNGVPGTTTADIAYFADATTLNTTALNMTVNIAASPNPFATITFGTTAASGYDLTATNGAAFTLNATGSTVTNSAVVASNTSGTNTFDAPVNFSAATATIFTPGTSTAVLTFNGVLSGTNIQVAGKDTINFNGANTYTGGTSVGFATGTVLVVKTISASGGGASNLGAATSATAGFISLGNNSASGTLQYLGAGSTTDRQVALSNSNGGANTSVIDSSGTGALVFTGVAGTNDVTTKSTAATQAAHALTLTGSFGSLTTPNVFGEKLTDLTAGTPAVSSPTSVFKTGNGAWSLTGANSYTGGTSITGGTVIAGSTTALGAASAPLTIGTAAVTLDLAVDSSVAAYNTTITSATTILSDRATAGAGITHTLGTLSLGGTTLTASAGSNVTSGTAGLTFGSTTLTASLPILNPTNAVLTLGAVTSTSTAALSTLTLSGSSSGNQITGVVSDGTKQVAITKSNPSTWTLSGANTYTGLTTLNGGTLIVSNSSNSGSAYTGGVTFGTTASILASGAGSVGFINGTVTTKSNTVSTISPGGAGTVGMLTLNALAAATGSAFAFDLGATSGGMSSDTLAVTGALGAATSGTGSLAFNFNNLGATPGTKYTLVTFGSQTGLDTGDLTATGVAGTFSLDANDIYFTVTAVPEPSTWMGALFLSVLGAFGLRRRLRCQQA